MYSVLQNPDYQIMYLILTYSGYNVIRLDPKTHKDTGLLLYFSHSVNLKRASHLEQHNTESIWIEVCLKRSKPILVGFTYRNPSERTDWFDRFTLMMDAVCLEAKEIILLGDFNISLLKPHIKWNQLYENFNLHQLINKPTRITTTSETLIDHIYVTTKQNIAEVCSPVHRGTYFGNIVVVTIYLVALHGLKKV